MDVVFTQLLLTRMFYKVYIKLLLHYVASKLVWLIGFIKRDRQYVPKIIFVR